ncbi:MAG: uracil-DNA glycosylase [Sphingomonadales bacterium]|nr:MAG: uracil-DNA glycosylase [Sphingomonadales bacterium]
MPVDAPSPDCPHCPRLAAFRAEQRAAHPDWFNAPVPPLGDPDAWLAIIGLAPGLKGANRTGRAFTGDGSGAMLFAVLAELGLARGEYDGDAADGLSLDGAIIINAVRCVPPANRPTPAEVRACQPYLLGPLQRLPRLRAIVALGRIAHDATLAAIGARAREYRFGHGARHALRSGLILIDSYHCSRYNQNTGRINHKMLWSVVKDAVEYRSEPPPKYPENMSYFQA